MKAAQVSKELAEFFRLTEPHATNDIQVLAEAAEVMDATAEYYDA